NSVRPDNTSSPSQKCIRMTFCRDRRARSWRFQKTRLCEGVLRVRATAQAGCDGEPRGPPSAVELDNDLRVHLLRSGVPGPFARVHFQEVPLGKPSLVKLDCPE